MIMLILNNFITSSVNCLQEIMMMMMNMSYIVIQYLITLHPLKGTTIPATTTTFITTITTTITIIITTTTFITTTSNTTTIKTTIELLLRH